MKASVSGWHFSCRTGSGWCCREWTALSEAEPLLAQPHRAFVDEHAPRRMPRGSGDHDVSEIYKVFCVGRLFLSSIPHLWTRVRPICSALSGQQTFHNLRSPACVILTIAAAVHVNCSAMGKERPCSFTTNLVWMFGPDRAVGVTWLCGCKRFEWIRKETIKLQLFGLPTGFSGLGCKYDSIIMGNCSLECPEREGKIIVLHEAHV